MNKRTGFSVVDLSALIALFTILVVLILPAVQDWREQARNRICTFRLGAIGTGAQNYENSFERLPSCLGARGAVEFSEWLNSGSTNYWGSKQYASPLAMIDFARGNLDIDPVFVDFDTYEISPQFWLIPNWQTLAEEERARYRCPSDQLDPLVATNTTLAIQPTHQGVLSQDSLGTLFGATGTNWAYTNYVGCMGAGTGGSQRAGAVSNGIWTYRGMITSRETMTSCFVSDADGLSNTIMFGENIGSIETTPFGTEVTIRQSWINGALGRGRGNAGWMSNGDEQNRLIGIPSSASGYGFGSAHRFGTGFVMGDGSIRRLTNRIDWQTFYELCGAFDTWDF
ncbi:MAG: DUF1559 domain-containing protein [Planctomycetota bacterium]